MTPFVLMADMDKAVIDVTTLVPRINKSPCPGIKRCASYKFLLI
jgi:hypothetical protein